MRAGDKKIQKSSTITHKKELNAGIVVFHLLTIILQWQ